LIRASGLDNIEEFAKNTGLTIDNRPVIRPLDDGIMAVLISNEQRSNADAEMEDVIQKDERLLFEDVHLEFHIEISSK
jgi:hypothetical protein